MANYKTSWVQRLIEGAWQKTFAFAHAKTVYTDFANKKTLADKLSEIDTEIGNKANKTEIPTELPANGGNSATVNGHTVKSDVPENAVFTDTVYDDTEIKESIEEVNSNLSNLGKVISYLVGEYSYTHDWNNDFVVTPITNTTDDVIKIRCVGSTQSFADNYSNMIFVIDDRDVLSVSNTSIDEVIDLPSGSKLTVIMQRNADGNIKIYSNDIGSRVSNINSNLVEQKMLGWSVPRECPIQNEVNGNQFVQKVGRVDLGSIDWTYDTSSGHERFRNTNVVLSFIKPTQTNEIAANIYTNGYITDSANGTYLHVNDNSIAVDIDSVIWVYDSSYTDVSAFKKAMKGQYLYYELATPITTTIDGNEIGETVSDVRKETTINLFKPTSQTATQKGITCTNNGDGTYTISGTSTAQVTFQLAVNVKVPISCILTGCKGGSPTTYMFGVFDGANYFEVYDIDNAKEIPAKTYRYAYIVVRSGVTIPDNTIITPMITTNLNATYDDFVPYTGDSGSINGDVADLRGDVDEIGITHKHSFFEPAVVNVKDNSYTYDFYLKDGYDFNDLIDGNGCGVAMVFINNGNAIKGSYGMLLLLSISPRLNAPDMINMIHGRTTGPGMEVTRVEYRAASASKKGFRVIASASSSAPVDTFKALYTNVASWTNICNM